MSYVEIAAIAGLALGLGALWRGLRAQRTAARVEGLGTSRITALAAGEVRVSGVVESAGVTLTSPILGRACVFYASRIAGKGDDAGTIWADTSAVGFLVRDASGTIRVLP